MVVLSQSFYVQSLLSTLFCVTLLAVVQLWVRQASQETAVQVCPKKERKWAFNMSENPFFLILPDLI